MDNKYLERLTQSNLKLIEAIAMHSENEQAKIEGKSLPYREDSFYELINQFHQN